MYDSTAILANTHRDVTCLNRFLKPGNSGEVMINILAHLVWLLLPSGYVKIANWKMAIEIVDFPIKNGDFHSYVELPEGIVRGIQPWIALIGRERRREAAKMVTEHAKKLT